MGDHGTRHCQGASLRIQELVFRASAAPPQTPNRPLKLTAFGGRLAPTLVPSPVSCAQPPVPALRPVPKAYLPFGPPALVQQAPPAIIPAVLRRFRGPALFRGLRPSSSQGAPFWPSGLTLRSSRPAYGGRLTLAVRRHNQLHLPHPRKDDRQTL